MKLYNSFLVRCWLILDSPEKEGRVVLNVEHIQTGGHIRVANLTEAETWMLGACRTTQPPAEAAQDAEQERGQPG